MEEESYFFKLSRFQERLVNNIKSNPTFAQPEQQRDFLLKRLEEPLLDLSISRTNFNWGIPFPFDTRHVMYVWFDALTNYLSGVDWPEGENKFFWPPDLQIIGKDISWFHCVIWPCMLFSAGIEPPKSVCSSSSLLSTPLFLFPALLFIPLAFLLSPLLYSCFFPFLLAFSSLLPLRHHPFIKLITPSFLFIEPFPLVSADSLPFVPTFFSVPKSFTFFSHTHLCIFFPSFPFFSCL